MYKFSPFANTSFVLAIVKPVAKGKITIEQVADLLTLSSLGLVGSSIITLALGTLKAIGEEDLLKELAIKHWIIYLVLSLWGLAFVAIILASFFYHEAHSS